MMKGHRRRNFSRASMGSSMGLVPGSTADPKYGGGGALATPGTGAQAADPPVNQENFISSYQEPAPTRIEALGGATISSAVVGALTALAMFQVARWMKKDLSKMGDLVTVGTITSVGFGVISALFFGWRGFSVRVMGPRQIAQ